MKRLFTILTVVLLTATMWAQSPEKVSYQAVIRDGDSKLVTTQVGMQISILQGSESGTAVYVETQTPTPNINGLVTIEIGSGTLVSGNFSTINWANGPYYIKTETAVEAPLTTYTIIGTSQLLSVPYALYAKTSKKADELEVKLQMLTNSVLAGEMVADIDRNSYYTVKIGTQIWMAENLKTTKYSDGTAIPLVTNNTAWWNLITPGYCWYDNDETTYKATYGALYNWYAVSSTTNGNKNICPTGWHVPTDVDWTTLTDYLGGLSVAGGKLKEIGTTHWLSPNTGATNETGFTALAGGSRKPLDGFDYIGYWGHWWSATVYSSDQAYSRICYYNSSNANWDAPMKKTGLSVRCVRD